MQCGKRQKGVIAKSLELQDKPNKYPDKIYCNLTEPFP